MWLLLSAVSMWLECIKVKYCTCDLIQLLMLLILVVYSCISIVEAYISGTFVFPFLLLLILLFCGCYWYCYCHYYCTAWTCIKLQDMDLHILSAVIRAGNCTPNSYSRHRCQQIDTHIAHLYRSHLYL